MSTWRRWFDIDGPTAFGRQGPELTGRSLRYVQGQRRWWFTGAVFVLFLIPDTVTVVELNRTGHPTPLVVTLIVLYGLGYAVLPPFVWRRSGAIRMAVCGALIALGIAVVALLGGSSPMLLVYAMVIVALLLPTAWVIVIDGGILVVIVGAYLARGLLEDNWGPISTLLSVCITVFFMGRMIRSNRELRRAHDEIATLAVAAERERLARDLHDILGHSLTTITVKAGLARRVLESGGATERAVEEIHEVEGLSRRALADVRATVSDYRQVSLSSELVGARAALRAADIDADLPQAVDDVRADLQGPFGYVLREAVTNILRHSGASTVSVRLAPTSIEITDDGVGGTVGAGNGLRGLSERLRDVGATLSFGPREGVGFRVVASATAASTVPAASSTAGTSSAGERA